MAKKQTNAPAIVPEEKKRGVKPIYGEKTTVYSVRCPVSQKPAIKSMVEKHLTMVRKQYLKKQK